MMMMMMKMMGEGQDSFSSFLTQVYLNKHIVDTSKQYHAFCMFNVVLLKINLMLLYCYSYAMPLYELTVLYNLDSMIPIINVGIPYESIHICM